MSDYLRELLSRLEYEVLELTARGLSDVSIATELSKRRNRTMSIKCVENAHARIYSKLGQEVLVGTGRRVAAVARFKEENIDQSSTINHNGYQAYPHLDSKHNGVIHFTLPKLSSRYTFSSFVIGSCNGLAHAMAQAVVQKLETTYNPLFIYGGSGLGKTHLLQAMAHVTVKAGRRAIYITAEQLANEFNNAIRQQRTDDFRNIYSTIDLLLLDDIQFITGKEQIQEILFNIFDELYNANHQIVLSSNFPPGGLHSLDDRLRSRFEWGLIVSMQKPDFQTRYAILHSKAERQGVGVSPEVLNVIAEFAQTSVRELEGALNRVIAYAGYNKLAITKELAAQVLAEVVADSGGAPTRRESLTRFLRPFIKSGGS